MVVLPAHGTPEPEASQPANHTSTIATRVLPCSRSSFTAMSSVRQEPDTQDVHAVLPYNRRKPACALSLQSCRYGVSLGVGKIVVAKLTQHVAA